MFPFVATVFTALEKIAGVRLSWGETCNRTRKPGEFNRMVAVALVVVMLPDHAPPIKGPLDCAQAKAVKTKRRKL